MDIILIRHGDPDYENDTLTSNGHEEAKLLAEHLRDLPVAAIFQSPYGRARRTCEYTAKAVGCEPTTFDWLKEGAIMRGDLWLWSAPGPLFLSSPELPTLQNWLEPDGAMPEGKAQFDIVSRGFDEVVASFGYVKAGHLYQVSRSGSQVLLFFSHHGAIATLLSYLLHWPLPLAFVHCRIDPTGLTWLRMEEHKGFAHPRLMVLNSLAHLNLGGPAASGHLPGPTEDRV